MKIEYGLLCSLDIGIYVSMSEFNSPFQEYNHINKKW